MALALIDGDEAIYKACVIKGQEIDWDTGESSAVAPSLEDAKDTLVSLIDDWTSKAGCDESLIVLSPLDRRLFRRGVFPAYKGGRGEKPEHFWELEAFVRREFNFKAIHGLEADDVMGLLSGPDTVICSQDKDMKTVPGRLFNPGKGTLGVISPDRADWQWMFQTLTGDTTDGFKGCPKIGPKKAEALLDQGTSLRAWWPLVRDAFIEKGLTERDAITQAVCARILRPGDYADGRISYHLASELIELDVDLIAA